MNQYTKEDTQKCKLIFSEVLALYKAISEHYDLLRDRVRTLIFFYFVGFVWGVCFIAVQGKASYLLIIVPLLVAFFVNVIFLFFFGKELHGNAVPSRGYPYDSLVNEKWYNKQIAQQFLGLAMGCDEDAVRIKAYIDRLVLVLKISHYLTLAALLLGVVIWLFRFWQG